MFVPVWVRTKAAPHNPTPDAANSHRTTVNVARLNKPIGHSPLRRQVKLGAPGLTMKLLATLSICCLLALASAVDSPQRCTSPDQMEGMLSIFLPLQYSEDYGMFSYDATNKRFYSDLFISSGEETWQQVNILLFQKSVMYQYYPQDKTCLKGPIQGPFQKFGVPHNATLLGPSFLGTLQVPGAGLLCNNWNGFEGGAYYLKSFTDSECFPLYEAHVPETGWFSISYMNITLGIRDPTVFTPPPECEDPVQELSPRKRLHPWAWSSLSLG